MTWHQYATYKQLFPFRSSSSSKYGMAVVFTTCSLAGRWFLSSILGLDAPLLMFILAVVLSAWYGGGGPGYLATLLSALVGSYFFLPPTNSIAIASVSDRLRLLLFVLEGFTISLVYAQLHRAYMQAAKAIRARDDFLSVAAHELKTPVTSLQNYSEVLLRQLRKDQPLNPTRATHVLTSMHGQAERLGRLIDQLLDVSRIDAGKLSLALQPTDVTDLVREVVNSFQPTAPDHVIHLEAKQMVWGIVDPLRLEQVLRNVLSNAVKYSLGGGEIYVLVDQPVPEQIVLSVTDQGIGIAPEHRAHIFDRFYQVHGAGYLGGLGLGLSISQQIAELHGGQLVVEFPEGGGTRVVVYLPSRFPSTQEDGHGFEV